MIVAERISQKIKRSRLYDFEHKDFKNFASYNSLCSSTFNSLKTIS